jgi:ATP-dependent Clp protease protease subunit
MTEPNFNVVMLAKGKARVEIYDLLGPSMHGMIDARTVSEALKKAGDLSEIELRINSKGGDVFEGLAITNILKQHKAQVHVVVDGVAASAASLIAMGGDTVRIPKNALMMIHAPRKSTVFGTEDDHRKSAETLRAVTAVVNETYAARSKQTPDTVAAWMNGETWFSGQQAVEAGLADQTDSELSLAGVEPQQHVALMYENAPSEFESLYALSMRSTKEPPMAEPIVTPTVETPAAPVAPVVPAAPQLTAADVQSAADKAVADERSRISAVSSVCQKAGKPDMANEFIANGTSLADVQTRMFEVLCAARPPVGDAGGTDAPPAKDPDAQAKADYAAERVLMQRAGITEEDYVTSRRISAGTELLLTR